MRICFISRRYFPAISGMSIYASNYLKEMVKLGHDVVMISQYRNDVAGTQIYGGGPPPPLEAVKIIGLESIGEQEVNAGKPADFELDVNNIVQAALVENTLKPFDIVHAQYAYPNGLAAIEISRLLGIPNVISIQGGDGHWVGLCCDTHKKAMHAVLFYANELVIGSQSFAQEVHENHQLPIERLTVVPGAINSDHFKPNENKELGSLSNTPVLLYHGRVDKRKGVLELIEAINQLVRMKMNLVLHISGIGPDLEEAKIVVQDLNLGNSVKFLGYVSYQDVPSIYQHADIFVSPTWSEGFSNTILEAMACGLPIVAAKSIGVVDCLTDCENALLHETHNVDDLCQKLISILEDQPLRLKLAANALNEIETKYKWERIAVVLESLLEKNINKNPNNTWIDHFNINKTVLDADLACRFRNAPHLL